ncbi:hypothetical protein BDY21DRAFT_378526 [Lineolata rhizophorae]|uniref:Uncharacterized protein n=1 Tax=Lineolata rhizophorae TaxID=578093 RepID=A0A6A6P5R9_9PEZI|nr:hypothetical protein BDY21DRAFT_378526 [Lineolata rhizophorae]
MPSFRSPAEISRRMAMEGLLNAPEPLPVTPTQVEAAEVLMTLHEEDKQSKPAEDHDQSSTVQNSPETEDDTLSAQHSEKSDKTDTTRKLPTAAHAGDKHARSPSGSPDAQPPEKRTKPSEANKSSKTAHAGDKHARSSPESLDYPDDNDVSDRAKLRRIFMRARQSVRPVRHTNEDSGHNQTMAAQPPPEEGSAGGDSDTHTVAATDFRTPERASEDAEVPRDFECVIGADIEEAGRCYSGQYDRKYARKCVSDFFGRNKLETRMIPKWRSACRMHYQRTAYKRGRWQQRRIDLIREQFQLNYECRPDLLYSVAPAKREQERLMRYLDRVQKRLPPQPFEKESAEDAHNFAKGKSQYMAPVWILAELADANQFGRHKTMADCLEIVDTLEKHLQAGHCREVPLIEFVPDWPLDYKEKFLIQAKHHKQEAELEEEAMSSNITPEPHNSSPGGQRFPGSAGSSSHTRARSTHMRAQSLDQMVTNTRRILGRSEEIPAIPLPPVGSTTGSQGSNDVSSARPTQSERTIAPMPSPLHANALGASRVLPPPTPTHPPGPAPAAHAQHPPPPQMQYPYGPLQSQATALPPHMRSQAFHGYPQAPHQNQVQTPHGYPMPAFGQYPGYPPMMHPWQHMAYYGGYPPYPGPGFPPGMYGPPAGQHHAGSPTYPGPPMSPPHPQAAPQQHMALPYPQTASQPQIAPPQLHPAPQQRTVPPQPQDTREAPFMGSNTSRIATLHPQQQQGNVAGENSVPPTPKALTGDDAVDENYVTPRSR